MSQKNLCRRRTAFYQGELEKPVFYVCVSFVFLFLRAPRRATWQKRVIVFFIIRKAKKKNK